MKIERNELLEGKNEKLKVEKKKKRKFQKEKKTTKC